MSAAPFRVFGSAARTETLPPRIRPLWLAARSEYSQTQVSPYWLDDPTLPLGHSIGYVVFPEPATLSYG